MQFILHSDDFGQNDDTLDATIECFERGALTSATIMPKMPATERAVEYALKHPEFSFGVHLTYVRENDGTPESPVSPASTIPDLADQDGRFFSSNAIRKRALLNKISVEQIAAETSAQIESLQSRGVKISHVDSHGHLHKFAPFRKALQQVLPKFGIRRVRGVQTVYLKKPLKSPTFWLGGIWNRKLKKLFTNPDQFFMPDTIANPDWPEKIVSILSGNTIEIGVHPGFAEAWRDADRLAVQRFATLAKSKGHELINWNDI